MICDNRMNPKYTSNINEKPFAGMKIDNNNILNSLEGRQPCPQCYKSRKYFCYTCYVPIPQLDGVIPNLKLPIKIDIIKHQHEIDGKSTAVHAAVLAPNDVKIYTYPDMPDYSKQEKVVLIFPSVNAVNIPSLFGYEVDNEAYSKEALKDLPPGSNLGTLMTKRVESCILINGNMIEENLEELPIKRAVFIDSTWNQSRSIYKDRRIREIPTIVIQNRISQFWRHQKGSPRWYLSTVEAIHQFLIEMHLNAWGVSKHYEGPYCSGYRIVEDTKGVISAYHGQYDNLLYFFSYMYDKIHMLYSHDNLKAYQRPIM